MTFTIGRNLGYLVMKPKIRLVTRADEAGSCRSANEAILEAVEAGIIKNVSFMAVGPEIEHAVELLGGREDICYGAYLTLNAEWEEVKWKPILQWFKLVDRNGYFLPDPTDSRQAFDAALAQEELKGRFAEPADVWDGLYRETNFQIGTLLEMGLNISYVDEHLEFSITGLSGGSSSSEFIDGRALPSLPEVEPLEDSLKTLQKRLRMAMLDTYLWVTLPGKDAPDMQRFYLSGGKPGIVARERDAERELLCHPQLGEILARFRAVPTRYDEVLRPK